MKYCPLVNRTRKLCYSKDCTVRRTQQGVAQCKREAIFLGNRGNKVICVHIFLYLHKETLKICKILEKWLPIREKIGSLFNVVLILESDEE